MAGSVCTSVLKHKCGQPHRTTCLACPRPISCPGSNAYEARQKQQFFGQADKEFYIAQKHIQIKGKVILSERICARKENPGHLSIEENVMKEKQIEQKLVSTARNMGGVALKLVCPGFAGMPDRIVLLQNGHIGFVEVKAPGEKPRPLQLTRHGLLQRLGFKVYVLDDERQIKRIIMEIGGDAE